MGLRVRFRFVPVGWWSQVIHGLYDKKQICKLREFLKGFYGCYLSIRKVSWISKLSFLFVIAVFELFVLRFEISKC